jgi:hypothetical protein
MVLTNVRCQVTKNQTPQKSKYYSRRHGYSDSVTQVLLDIGSDGECCWIKKGTSMHFHIWPEKVALSWHSLNGNFLSKCRSKVILKFFDYSNSNEHMISSGVVEYDKKLWPNPFMTSFLVVNLWKIWELFWILEQSQSLDKVVLPMRDINSVTKFMLAKA